MRKEHEPVLFTIAFGLFVGVASIILILFLSCDARAKVPCKTFACGVDAGRSFLPPDSPKGVKMRYHFQKMHRMWGPWCWEYQRNNYVGCLSRIWFESRGDPFSRTKDTKELEAGLTSLSWGTAKLLEQELGVGGDPCGDPEYAIAAAGWSRGYTRQEMFEGTRPDGSPTYWSGFLPDLWDRNRIEAEYFISVCGSINCQKLRKMLRVAEAREGVMTSNHPWWNFISWAKGMGNKDLVKLVQPLAVKPWRFGFRIGRSSINGWRKRAEFFPPLEGGEPNYCWGTKPFNYPAAMPDPKTPITKQKDWRKGCVHYSKKKARKKLWNPPEMDGPEWKAWVDEQQALGLLPSDEEYSSWEHDMAQAGCAFQYIVSEEAWEKAQAKLQKKAKKNGH